MYKNCMKKENLAAQIMFEVFEQRNIQYNLCSRTDFQLGAVKSVSCGLRALNILVQKYRT